MNLAGIISLSILGVILLALAYLAYIAYRMSKNMDEWTDMFDGL